jgi:O-acetyl-ADP-ribose deacetylase (regulator of RNase III)
MPINYVKGDATHPPGEDPRIVVHVCNDIGAWGAGFVLAVSKKWPAAERGYREWHKSSGELPFELGQVQFVQVEPAVWVANLIGQRGVTGSRGVPPIRYDAVREGLARVASFAAQHGASVHMPRIGCGLAGGTWEEVGRLVEEELAEKGVAVTVYDLK